MHIYHIHNIYIYTQIINQLYETKSEEIQIY